MLSNNLYNLNVSDISWQIYLTKISGQKYNNENSYLEIDSSNIYANNTNIYGKNFIGDLSGNADTATKILTIDNSNIVLIDVNRIKIGNDAGKTDQCNNSIAIGKQAGNQYQNPHSIAIGTRSGMINQEKQSVAIGPYSGVYSQRQYSIAIGSLAGNQYQGTESIAIGRKAGATDQSNNSIAIGNEAGETNQGEYSIAIGHKAGSVNQSANSIVINAQPDISLNNPDASGNNPDASGLYIAPIRNRNDIDISNLLFYDTQRREIFYNSSINTRLGIIDVSLNYHKNRLDIIDISLIHVDNSINNILTGTTLFSGDKTFTGTIDISSGILRGPSNFYIDPSPYGISDVSGIAGRVIIRGDLQVDGIQTIVNSTQVDISDKTILLASGSNNITEADGAGIEIHNSNGDNPSILYNESTNTWDFNRNITAGYFIGDLSGIAKTNIDTSFNDVSGRLDRLDTSVNLFDNSFENVYDRLGIIDTSFGLLDNSLNLKVDNSQILDNTIDVMTYNPSDSTNFAADNTNQTRLVMLQNLVQIVGGFNSALQIVGDDKARKQDVSFSLGIIDTSFSDVNSTLDTIDLSLIHIDNSINNILTGTTLFSGDKTFNNKISITNGTSTTDISAIGILTKRIEALEEIVTNLLKCKKIEFI